MAHIFNVGVVGLGEQAWDNLLPSLALIRNCHIAALCDIDSERTADAVRAYSGKPYQDFRDMIANEKLDAVIVASYPQVHEEVLEITLQKGIPTFVEKPPTTTTAKLEYLIHLNKTHYTKTAVGLNFNFTDAFQFIKALERKPEFGTVQYIKVNHYGNKPSTPLWGLSSTTRSFLLAQAIHPLGILLNFGELTSVKPAVSAFTNREGLFVSASMKLQNHAGGIIDAQVNTMSMAPFFQWDLELITSNGVILTVDSLWEVKIFSKHRDNKIIDNQKWWHDSWQPSPLANGYKRTGYENQFRYFFDCLENDKPNLTAIENLVPLYKLMDIIEDKVDATAHSYTRKQVHQY